VASEIQQKRLTIRTGVGAGNGCIRGHDRRREDRRSQEVIAGTIEGDAAKVVAENGIAPDQVVRASGIIDPHTIVGFGISDNIGRTGCGAADDVARGAGKTDDVIVEIGNGRAIRAVQSQGISLDDVVTAAVIDADAIIAIAGNEIARAAVSADKIRGTAAVNLHAGPVIGNSRRTC
jgi:hypothetical protein